MPKNALEVFELLCAYTFWAGRIWDVMFGEAGYVIGQILSVVAVVLGFISYQMKTPKGMLVFQITTALVFFSALSADRRHDRNGT